MFTQAGFAGAVKADEAEADALARALVIRGNEATMWNRVQELLASSLDELLTNSCPRLPRPVSRCSIWLALFTAVNKKIEPSTNRWGSMTKLVSSTILSGEKERQGSRQAKLKHVFQFSRVHVSEGATRFQERT
jgi:hypothetical protein